MVKYTSKQANGRPNKNSTFGSQLKAPKDTKASKQLNSSYKSAKALKLSTVSEATTANKKSFKVSDNLNEIFSPESGLGQPPTSRLNTSTAVNARRKKQSNHMNQVFEATSTPSTSMILGNYKAVQVEKVQHDILNGLLSTTNLESKKPKDDCRIDNEVILIDVSSKYYNNYAVEQPLEEQKRTANTVSPRQDDNRNVTTQKNPKDLNSRSVKEFVQQNLPKSKSASVRVSRRPRSLKGVQVSERLPLQNVKVLQHQSETKRRAAGGSKINSKSTRQAAAKGTDQEKTGESYEGSMKAVWSNPKIKTKSRAKLSSAQMKVPQTFKRPNDLQLPSRISKPVQRVMKSVSFRHNNVHASRHSNSHSRDPLDLLGPARYIYIRQRI